MKCPYSGKPCLKAKEIQITENVNGEVRKLHLCHDCGSQYIKMPEQEVINKTSDIKFTPSGQITSEVSIKDTVNVPCPKCGTTAGEIMENPKAGCDICRMWHSTVENLVTETKNRKNDPSQGQPHSRFKTMGQIKVLQERLDLAIKREDYEEAALLRDALAAVNKRLSE
jgi:protein-arginine kinase activator protein McsA